MAIELFSNDKHKCIKFDNLTGDGEIQSNQFLIVDGRRGLLIDCGGYRIYSSLLGEVSRYLPTNALDYIFLSHQDPDIGSGLNLWLPVSKAQVVISDLWKRFIPAFCIRGLSEERITPIPDNGLRLTLGDSELIAVPAHFLHSPGNFHLYDTSSKILFTGDLGASIGPEKEAITTEEEFTQHVSFLAGFHNRYMASTKACVAWVKMVKQLDVEMIVPQHGARIVGKPQVEMFYDWVLNEKTALDDFAEELFQLPA